MDSFPRMNGTLEVITPSVYSRSLPIVLTRYVLLSSFVTWSSHNSHQEPPLKVLLILGTDVNPPVHAWSVFRVFKIERKLYGRSDLDFLGKTFETLAFPFMDEC